MGDAKPAARVSDPVGHSCALTGALAGLAMGALIGVAIIATGGLGAVAIGAALAVTGGVGLAGEYIGESIPGPPTGMIAVGFPTVLVNNLPASAVAIGLAPCAQEGGIPQAEASGASSVLIGGMPAGCAGENFTCSAKVLQGSPDVQIGGPSAQVLPVTPEVPVWLNNTMQALTIGGTVLATGGVAAIYGPGTALGGLGGGYVGAALIGSGGRTAASALGFGETGQRVAEVLGGFAGGALGGGGGARGGGAFDSRYVVTSEGLGSNFGNVRIRPRPPPSTESPFQTRYDPANPGRPDPRWSVDTRNFDPSASGATRTSTGAIRDKKQFWNEWSQRNPQTLSKGNQYRIEKLGQSPKVDKTWLDHFPEHSGYKGQTIEHHHYNHGDVAIPLPWEVHRGAGNYNIWHGGP